MRQDYKKVVLFFLLCIIYTRFFQFKSTILFFDLILKLIFPFLVFYSFGHKRKNNGYFKRPILYIILSILFASVVNYFTWQQSIFEIIKGLSTISFFLLYFIMHRSKISTGQLHKILLSISYLVLILYTFQVFFTTEILFGFQEEFKETRGTLRIVFPGEGFLFYGLLYYLGKLGKSKFRIKYLLLLLPFLWMLFSQVTRIYILAFFLILVYHFMLKSKVIYRIILILFVISVYSYVLNTDNAKVVGLREKIESDTKQGDKYIRFLAVNHFFNEFSPYTINQYLGNGPIYFGSRYGEKITFLREKRLYFLEDLGLLKGYVLYGILFVYGYLIIFKKSFTIRVPYTMNYLKYYIWFILAMSLTTRANTAADFGLVLLAVLYMLEKNMLNSKNIKN